MLPQNAWSNGRLRSESRSLLIRCLPAEARRSRIFFSFPSGIPTPLSVTRMQRSSPLFLPSQRCGASPPLGSIPWSTAFSTSVCMAYFGNTIFQHLLFERDLKGIPLGEPQILYFYIMAHILQFTFQRDQILPRSERLSRKIRESDTSMS